MIQNHIITILVLCSFSLGVLGQGVDAVIDNTDSFTCYKTINFWIEGAVGDDFEVHYGDGVVESFDEQELEEKEYTYSDSGCYTFMLIAKSGGQTDTARYGFCIVDPEVDFNYTHNSNCITDKGYGVAFENTSTITPPDVMIPDDLYVWNFGDGSLYNGFEAEHDYTYPGRHKVTLELNVRGCNASATDIIEISTDTGLVEGIIAEESCPCNEYSLSAEGTADEYTWYIQNIDSGGEVELVGERVNYTFEYPGQRNVTLIGKDESTGCIYRRDRVIEVCPNDLISSRSNDQWVIGEGSVFDFTSGSLNISNNVSPMISYEAVASMSDHLTGELLFYTNGIKVYNRNHQVMLNGDSLKGNPITSSSQGCLIIPMPGNEDRYYIFTNSGFTNAGSPSTQGYHYAVVDMTLDNGLGGVLPTSKNTPVFTGPCSEAPFYRVMHESQSGVTRQLRTCSSNASYWYVIPACYDNFYAYLITESGIALPVESSFPRVDNFEICNTFGCSAFSRDGSLFAIAENTWCGYKANNVPTRIRIFDFDLNTGQLSNPKVIFAPTGTTWDIEFSPDNAIIYYSGDSNKLYQASIKELDMTKTRLIHNGAGFNNKGYTTIELAADGKIYIKANATDTFSVINNPNIYGIGCDFQPVGVDMGQTNTLYKGMQNFVPLNVIYRDSVVADFEIDSSACMASQITLHDNTNYLNAGDCSFYKGDYLWDFGDGMTSTEVDSVHHVYNEPGNYQVKLIVNANRSCASDTFEKEIVIAASSAYISGGDTLFVENGQIIGINIEGGHLYQWIDVEGLSCSNCPNPFVDIDESQWYKVVITDTVSNCTFEDSVFVQVGTELFIPNAFSPNSDGLQDEFRIIASGFKYWELTIYSRVGRRMYILNEQNNKWEGKINNRFARMGTYTYSFIGEDYEEEVLSKSGTITILK